MPLSSSCRPCSRSLGICRCRYISYSPTNEFRL